LVVRVHCPHCRALCQLDDSHVGSTVKCGKCANLFTVRIPGSAGISAAPPIKPHHEELLLELDGPEADAPGATSPPLRAPSLPLGLGCLDIGAATSPGQVRTRNEDSFLVQHLSWCNLDQRHEIALVVVADGLGGHEAGDKASGLAIRTIGASLGPLLGDALSNPQADLGPSRLTDAVCLAVQQANRAVYRQATEQPDCRGMGATAAVVLIVNGQAVIGHVGDCRVYHHGAVLTQITRDQTLVARMVELGQLTAEEALTHPSRNEVTQAIGRHADIAPAGYDVKLATGDWLIVASDGLSTHVNRAALDDAVRSSSRSALALAHHLVTLADQAGGGDNSTVVAIRAC